MKIYTKKGDRGKTSLIDAEVDKHDPRIEAIGSVDEANAAVGLAASALDRKRDRDLIELLHDIQHRLFDAGADLAASKPKTGTVRKLPADAVTRLEQIIDRYEENLPSLKRFVLPGGSRGSAQLHVARTAVRRAERRVAALAACEGIDGPIQRYLNRLSDCLFVFARIVNVREGEPDVEYNPE